MSDIKPVMLVVLDGWGLADPGPGNAIAAADPKFFNSLWDSCPRTAIHASGEHVGLPPDQFGNSEVGHLNLGAGRVVWQDITRIDKDIRERRFSDNPALKHVLETVRINDPRGPRIHVIGLTSDGGVHSSDRHYFALVDWLQESGIGGDRVFFHAITDGRDTPPKSALEHIERLHNKLADTGVGRIASVSGRYYAMDRDQRWDRVQKAWDVYTLGEGEVVPDAVAAVSESYEQGVTDEFITPKCVVTHGQPLGTIRDGDMVLFYNFRADRARQLCRALTDPGFDGFTRRKAPQVTLVTMTRYASDIPARVMYPPQSQANTLGQWLGQQGLSQFRCAETEKYAHVTYFFNGGEEQPNPGEERKLVNSPKVATYDEKPEMAAAEVAAAVSDALRSRRFDFVLVNFANPDMLGHTGVFDAAVKGIQATDEALRQVVSAARDSGFTTLVTADHGNAEEMLLHDSASTQHSHNLVPLVLVDGPAGARLMDGGKLADIGPTVLKLMGLSAPPEMTGNILLA